MPRPCAHFRLLDDRVTLLAAKFVDDQAIAEVADPVNFQPDLERLAAFRLLVHAELEHFLEAKASENTDSIAVASSRGPLLLREFPELFGIAIALQKGMPPQESLEIGIFSVYVSEIVASVRKAIGENNGVKSASFLRLSLFAGKTLDEVDSALSSSLNSYGKIRGDLAHSSVTHVRTLQAPSAEQAAARELVKQLAQYFDVGR